jgi:N-acetylglucosamine-6-phosphate deacetylase
MIRAFFLALTLFCLQISASVSIFSSPQLGAEEAARKIADLVLSNGKNKTVLGLATGNTMVPVYSALKKIIREKSIDLSHVITFNLDEYLDIVPSDPQSFHSFMFSHLFDELLASPENPRGILRENIHIPSGENWTDYEALITEHGPIDLQLLGIGRNGHIGFAEPGSPFDSRTLLVDLTEVSRRDYASFWNGNLDLVPKKAVTMGIATILQAKEILLLAFGENKANAIAKTLDGPQSTTVPATALQTHPKTSFILDEKAARLLNCSQITRFTHARILLDHQIQDLDLWVCNGKIIDPQEKADLEIDLHGKIVAPGLIDLQINGAFGCDFSRNPEEITSVSRQLLQYGVTAFLPTIVSSFPEQYREVIPRLQPRHFGKEGAAILGIHLEGPFFCPTYAGAHDRQMLLPCFKGSLNEVYGDLAGVKLVTLAPEIPGGTDLIKCLKEQGITVSVGHSSATLPLMRTGIDMVTHLFNAMVPYHHRNPAIIGAALIDPQLPYSLIVDGIHLSPEAIRLCWRCNPKGLILITDATEALGLPSGKYKLGTQEIEMHDDQIYLCGTNTIAGSNLHLDKAVRLLRSITNCSQAEALDAASYNPAKLIGIYPSKGTLAIGADADFIILSDDLHVEATYLGGALAWHAQ